MKDSTVVKRTMPHDDTVVEDGPMPIAMPKPVEKLRVVLYPHPALRKRCKPVERFDGELSALADRMLTLMREGRGVGLAGPQVGVLLRLFVCNPTGEPGDAAVWVNPVLSDLEGSVEAEEGCLSLPNINVPKRRAQKAVIEGFDVHGNPKRAQASDLLARIWQHETDHLDGILIIDAMSEAAELANRRTIRQLEADFSAARR